MEQHPTSSRSHSHEACARATSSPPTPSPRQSDTEKTSHRDMTSMMMAEATHPNHFNLDYRGNQHRQPQSQQQLPNMQMFLASLRSPAPKDQINPWSNVERPTASTTYITPHATVESEAGSNPESSILRHQENHSTKSFSTRRRRELRMPNTSKRIDSHYQHPAPAPVAPALVPFESGGSKRSSESHPPHQADLFGVRSQTKSAPWPKSGRSSDLGSVSWSSARQVDRSTPPETSTPLPWKRRKSHPELQYQSRTDSTDSRFAERDKGSVKIAVIQSSTFTTDTDPYEANPDLAMQLLDLFFLHVCCPPYVMFPKSSFTDWVTCCPTKSKDDRMLLYAVFSFATAYSHSAALQAIGAQLAEIASSAEEQNSGQPSLQLVQTQLHLSFYYFGRAERARARSFLGRCMQACIDLGLCNETGVQNVPETCDDYTFGFNRVQLIECRRRVFWIAYTSDHYNNHVTGQKAVLSDQDVFTRLPSSDSDYENGVDTNAPILRSTEPCATPSTMNSFSEMALWIVAALIWAEIASAGRRSVHQGAGHYRQQYEQTLARTQRRLKEWSLMLPPHLRYSAKNTESAIQTGCFGTYLQLHAMACAAGMTLHRCGRRELLEPETIRHNVLQAHLWARNMLFMVTQLSHNLVDRSNDTISALSLPLLPHIMLEACDIVSSGGEIESLLEVKDMLQAASAVMGELVHFRHRWSKHSRTIEERHIELTARSMSRYELKRWRLEDPMELEIQLLPKSHDLIYGSTSEDFTEATSRLRFQKAHASLGDLESRKDIKEEYAANRRCASACRSNPSPPPVSPKNDVDA